MATAGDTSHMTRLSYPNENEPACWILHVLLRTVQARGMGLINWLFLFPQKFSLTKLPPPPLCTSIFAEITKC